MKFVVVKYGVLLFGVPSAIGGLIVLELFETQFLAQGKVVEFFLTAIGLGGNLLGVGVVFGLIAWWWYGHLASHEPDRE
jgi:hypothetical protein